MMKFSAFIIISDHQITMEIQITPSNPEMTDHFPPQLHHKKFIVKKRTTTLIENRYELIAL